jgi:hypothetical protein
VRQKLEGIGLLEAKKTTEITTEVKHDLMKMPEVRADLMKASGQVGKSLFNLFFCIGLNKPYRAPVYRNYWECIQGLYR